MSELIKTLAKAYRAFYNSEELRETIFTALRIQVNPETGLTEKIIFNVGKNFIEINEDDIIIKCGIGNELSIMELVSFLPLLRENMPFPLDDID